MASTLKSERYKLELWIDDNGNVEDEAFAYPWLTSSAACALSGQELKLCVKYAPSSALKALIKAEQKAVVDVEVAK